MLNNKCASLGVKTGNDGCLHGNTFAFAVEHQSCASVKMGNVMKAAWHTGTSGVAQSMRKVE